jgi:glycosyltransferase involved in cell wall biosynthesis
MRPLVTARGDLVACTIISKNYLALARTLAQSYRRHHPGGRFFVLLADRLDGRFDPRQEPFELVEVESLGIPEFSRFSFRYSILELNTAVKAYFLRYLFEREGGGKVLYFDPDILLLGDVGRIVELLDRHSIVLTPHITSPYEDALKPTELDLLQAGAYNLGFLGLSATPTTHRFLRWWADRLFDKCQMARERGMHVDQKWIDLVPGLHEDVAIVRDPVFNVAYWNLHERVVRVRGDAVTVNGEPCRFFHFSGFDLSNLSRVSKHQSRFSMASLGETATLFRRYRDLVNANGHEETRFWPYAYAAFSHGVRIPEFARLMYRELGDEGRRFGDPFDASRRGSFFEWLRAGVDGRRRSDGTVSRLWYEIYAQHLDLQRLYPDVFERDRAAFLAWVVEHGVREHGIDPAFVPAGAPAPGGSSAGAPLRRRFYLDAVRPIEPLAKRWLKQTLQSHPRALRAVKGLRDRLQGPRPQPVLPRRRYEPGTAVQAWTTDEAGVNVAGYFTSEKGVGEAGRATVRALRAAGMPVELNDVVDSGSENRDSPGWSFSELNPYPVNLVHVNADQFPHVAATRSEAYFAGRINIGFWFWELSAFPEEWWPGCSRLDEVWVATAFAQEAVARVVPVPVVRMPVALEPAPAARPARERARFGLPEDAFVFLFAFDFHSFLERKNPLGLIEAFRLAFGDDDRVRLVLKSAHSIDAASGNPVTLVHEAAARAKNVTIIDAVLAREEMNALMTTADCYVSLHRSEGFGLPIAEAMRAGTPVIVTGYSGNMDFTTPANSFLVGYRLIELDRDHGPYRKGNLWADPDLEHAAELMRHVVERPEAAREVGRRGREHIERFHDPRRVGELMKQRLVRLVSERRAR